MDRSLGMTRAEFLGVAGSAIAGAFVGKRLLAAHSDPREAVFLKSREQAKFPAFPGRGKQLTKGTERDPLVAQPARQRMAGTNVVGGA